MVNVPSSDNSKMVATFRATKTYDWPTTCGLVIFCAASIIFTVKYMYLLQLVFDV